MAYGNGVNAPFGFQPRQYLDGSPWTGQQSEYYINGNTGGGVSYATSIFTGDLVTLLVDGTIGLTASGDNASIGVFFGCKYYDNTNTLKFSPYWPASTSVFANTRPVAFVIDDPNVLFDAQVVGTAPTTTSVNTINITNTASDLNWNYNIGIGTGNTTTGQSGAYIDLATQNTTAAHQLKLIRLTPRPNNNFGSTYNNGLVLLNNHVFKGGTGTAGI